MSFPAQAIAFTLWLRHRYALTALAASVALAAGFSALFGTPDVDPRVQSSLLMILALPGLLAPFQLMTMFAYGLEAHVESRGSCFPYRMFTLPVRTAELVLWPMLFGTTAVTLVWLVTARLILWPWGAPVPVIWPALLLAAVLAWAQALLWCPFGLPWLRVAVAAPLVGMVVAGTVAAVQLHVAPAFLYAFLAAQFPAAYLVAYIGLRAARRGDAPHWAWLTVPLTALLARQTGRYGRGRPFASGYLAQTWYERRHFGVKTPLLVAILLPWSLTMLALEQNPLLPTLTTENILAATLLIPIFVGGMGIDWKGKPNPGAKRAYGLTTFLATRPLGTAAMVAAKLEMALWTVLAAWAVWAAEVLIALVLSGRYREVWGWLQHWTAAAPLWEVAGTLFAAVVLLLALTWKNLIAGMCVSLTGREGIIRASGITFGALIFLAAAVAAASEGNPGLRTALLRALPWALGVAVVLKAGLAVWAVRELLRSGLVPERFVWALVGIWLGVAAILIALVVRLVPDGYAAPASLAAGVVLVLPLVRLSATPLALAWDRHQ
jgi:hypothetical protein